VPKTVQIRDIDDEVYAALQRHAAGAGLSVPELLRREVARIAARPSMEEWLERTRHGPTTSITSREVIEALDELRGPWPDAGR
jgi:antitoxin FitA